MDPGSSYSSERQDLAPPLSPAGERRFVNGANDNTSPDLNISHSEMQTDANLVYVC